MLYSHMWWMVCSSDQPMLTTNTTTRERDFSTATGVCKHFQPLLLGLKTMSESVAKFSRDTITAEPSNSSLHQAPKPAHLQDQMCYTRTGCSGYTLGSLVDRFTPADRATGLNLYEFGAKTSHKTAGQNQTGSLPLYKSLVWSPSCSYCLL